MTTTLLVFTDLDGTLLDHYNYDFSAASDALSSLKTLGVPCVLNTSKTYAELLELRQALQHKDPFIIENGAAVYVPATLNLNINDDLLQQGDFLVKAFGPERQQLIELSHAMKSRYDFISYHELTTEQLVEHTGLDPHTAELSLRREFTEPMIWNDSNIALEHFKQELVHEGIKVQKGGRFVHLMGQDCDKAVAMKWLKQVYQDTYHLPVTSIALGDGENDVGMISQADIPVVVRSPVHIPPEIPGRNDVWITDSYGPKGWSEAINQALANEGFI
ncbi:Glucosyl-3-phosphoglycerate/mannosyl-3-phosphoglycerate phosphatase [Marinomonas aquimarina]|uniref:Glucosyl-3-phosphoglycerate/mannosyl-3-phosphoglycerate phosphatase n=1 Tax=Marinomonas aquimarina TaxID=295068 RepID=A0A1A8TS78_9GAMM|nr:HAD-IIB family hydrolase [Marinomonas aquimarina]SBS36153.1 Glucosyl-3-phosphoglycerate/mannosyl-3-phosphoglycerate phosphatase [Marinomonas aquimarina]